MWHESESVWTQQSRHCKTLMTLFLLIFHISIGTFSEESRTLVLDSMLLELNDNNWFLKRDVKPYKYLTTIPQH